MALLTDAGCAASKASLSSASCLRGVLGSQRGVSLIEVLVVIVVLSVGLLGLAGLQASGMRVEKSSVHRTKAALLAYDMIDRMRLSAGSAAQLAEYGLHLSDAAPTGEGVPQWDLRDWRIRLQSLPAGTGSVEIDGSEATIVVQWDDSRGGGVLRGSSADDAARSQLQASQFRVTARITR